MLADIKERIARLAEMNRTLVQDLDGSRRLIADLGRERGVLQETVDELRTELAHRRSVADEEARTSRQRASVEGQRDRDRLLREVEAARAQAADAEERLRHMAGELAAAEQERDELRSQLLESSEAMDEILQTLERSDGRHGAARLRSV